MVTEKDVIEILKKKFIPEKAADLKKKFVAEYAVQGGGTWHLVIENKKAEFFEGPAEKSVCKMTFTDVESWYKLAIGELDGIAARVQSYSHGRACRCIPTCARATV